MAVGPLESSKMLVKGALVLSIAGILVKLLSAVYRIPYQNIVGDIGFYIYQQVYPFYGIAFTLATIGFPMVISKLIAERNQGDSSISVKDILFTAGILLSVLGLVLFSALYTGAERVAAIMGDIELAPLLRLVAFSFLLMPASALIRGFYQGKQDMIPTAVSQVVEQVVRVATILIMSFFLVNQGYSLYAAGAGAVSGSITGGFASLVLLLGFVVVRKEWNQPGRVMVKAADFWLITKALFAQGLAFCLTSLILVLVQLIDSLNLYALLRESGITSTLAKELKGVYDRGQPLIQLGTVVANALSLSMVPLISSYLSKGELTELHTKTKLALRISASIGIPAAMGLICLINPVNRMLFTDSKGSGTLAILALSIVFTSLIITKAAILQSIGRARVSILIVIVGLVFKLILNQALIPQWQIVGAAWATIGSFFIMSLLFYLVLRKVMKQPIVLLRDAGIIYLGTALMSGILYIYNKLFAFLYMTFGLGRMLSAIHTLTGVMIGVVIYGAFILRSGLYTKEELSLVPAGNKLAVLIRDRKEGAK
ncbi:polysaccharide biosynthesis protein [Peribacillus psychrosaccharolyticus]|uniref:Polysaccharide biosynthesis protein n=1 Tax=Peribacillus psychrosaccharolyticus TaxID=1407 RepID=A0A974NJ94_PERPY|nr:polysaccharide biosynthesis protein [Peribacillus psychrosaccharolyticus]MEC2058052.1 polysaccharide biosynthesis protein [Peribacillus psychrosaccharolyticus]MED3746089.1 polysaccharide biosynthesis protein [Peribacillus psychrosaccharolyticus]QQS98819.1 polysaccharide biosynthesis protein [Peribacillus psychrosaccharolyticus]